MQPNIHPSQQPRQPPKVNRIEIWRDTYQQSTKGRFSKVFVPPSIKLTEISIDIKPIYKQTQIHVLDMDTVDAAIDLKLKGYNPVLLNMADDRVAGGCVKSGSVAQEENLFRRSNYVNHLKGHFYPMNIKQIDLIYSKDVLFFKENEKDLYRYMKTPESLCVIACPALRFPALQESENKEMHFKNESDKILMKQKINMIYKVGYLYGHDTLVLSAHGCGAWGGPTLDIAYLFKEVSIKYNKCFRHIIFAILQDKMLEGWNKEGNFVTFARILTQSEEQIVQEQKKIAELPKPEDIFSPIHQVNETLYIGDVWSTKPEMIEEYGITAVLSVGMEPFDKSILETIESHYVDIDDTVGQAQKMLDEILPECVKLLEKWNEQNKVTLVHCAAGASRSATVIIAFLIKKFGWNTDQALSFLKRKRMKVQPNQGFLRILKEWETTVL